MESKLEMGPKVKYGLHMDKKLSDSGPIWLFCDYVA